MARPDAVLTGLLASFPVYAAIILWAFGTRSLPRMWMGLGGAITAFGLAFLLLQPAGAR